MRTAIAAIVFLSLAACTCWSAPSQCVIAPDGAERITRWQDSGLTTDAFVIYTPAWGPASPDNPWARSVIVRDGKVIKVVPNGAAQIPTDGYVLTGHGASAGWLRDHLPEGATVVLQPAQPFAEEQWERDADRVDPDVAEFPSGRGTDQLVVYTPAFGARTGTNIFGSESIVRNGRIVERSGGDSAIPADGFVISGHGRGSTWNMQHCPVGAGVQLDGTHLTVTRDKEAYFLEAEEDIRQAARRIEWAEGKAISCPLASAKAALAEARQQMAEARAAGEERAAEAEATLYAARRSAWTACARASETREVEARGAWMGSIRAILRPELRRDYFTKLQSANITMILPLVGSIIGQPDGEQLLRDIISDAHEFGIEVHPWTWLPAHSIPRSKDAERLAEHPEWADVAATGEPIAALDLANPQVREAITQDAVWLTSNFDIDGLHMDWEGMYGGFSEISRKGFQAEYGYDPLAPDAPTGPERTRDTYLWRVGLVDQVVADVVTALRATGRDIQISSATQCFDYHPNIATDTGASQQWIRWVARGQLDIACPMAYSQQVGFIRDVGATMYREIDGRSLHYIGLILYPETAQAGYIEPYQLLEQIDASREAGCEGIILFSAERLFSQPWTPDDRLLLTLREGPFRTRAALPHESRPHRVLERDATAPYHYAVAKLEQTAGQVSPGQAATLVVGVENWGTEPFEVTGAAVRSPTAWKAEPATPGAVLVEPGGKAGVPFMIQAPAEAKIQPASVRLMLQVKAGGVNKSVEVPAFTVKVVAPGP